MRRGLELVLSGQFKKERPEQRFHSSLALPPQSRLAQRE